MKKILFATIVVGLMIAGNAFACDGDGCLDGYIDSTYVGVEMTSFAGGHGDQVQAMTGGMYDVNKSYGDDVNGGTINMFGTYLSESAGTGAAYADGIAGGALYRETVQSWGNTVTTVDGCDGPACLDGTVENSSAYINMNSFVAGHGDAVQTATGGQYDIHNMFGGTKVNMIGGYLSESAGPGGAFADGFAGGQFNVDFKEAWGGITVPGN